MSEILVGGILALLLLSTYARAAEESRPLRVFIRASAKTHGPGAHDYPRFLEDWKKVLSERGAVVDGALRPPTEGELARTDVLILYASDGTNIGSEDRSRLESFLKRGGGLVSLHDSICGTNTEWFANLAGGAKQHGEMNWKTEAIKLHFEDRAHPITQGLEDLEMNDEMFFRLQMAPGAHVLATVPGPAGDPVPQLWTYEKSLGDGRPYRAFVSLQGHWYERFGERDYQRLLLRGIAWAARRPVDSLTRMAMAGRSGGAEAGASSSPRLGLKLLTEGLTAPITLISLPDGSGRLLVADQAGAIYVLNREGQRQEKPFLDLHSRIVALHQGMEERGVLGLALHPQFKNNRRFYVVYSAPLRAGGPTDWDHTMRLSEFRVSDHDTAAASLESERVLLEIDEPDWNHNSGRIVFGPDGYLYMTVGDGGAPNDVGTRGHAPEGNGQNLQTLLGKILRLDVNKGSPYGIPTDNPYADGKKGRPEIYAYGLRNPWGISFDRGGAHDLIVTDVGQDRWEELNLIVKGGNYGWRVREGFEGFDPKNPTSPPVDAPKVGADGQPFIDPVLVYKTLRGNSKDPEAYGVSITGGYVYRGKAIPELVGKYVFADWSRSMGVGDGTLLVATRPPQSGGAKRWSAQPLPVEGHPDGRVKAFIWALGEDEEGEIYVLTNGANMVNGTRGKVFKLVPM